MVNTTLCYLKRDGNYLMLHRIKKQNDINKDKWIGIGGKCEEGESPNDCILRETREETGYTLRSWVYHGVITFVSRDETGLFGEYMHLYSSEDFTGTPLPDCDEGVLEWLSPQALLDLPLWEGDLIFLRLMNSDTPFFSLKLVYDRGELTEAVLNGRSLVRVSYGVWE